MLAKEQAVHYDPAQGILFSIFNHKMKHLEMYLKQ